MKILHVITGLGSGGAEGVLFRICRNDSNNEHIVVSLTNENYYYEPLRKLGVKVVQLNFKHIVFSFLGLVRLFFCIKRYKPDVVQTWMYHSDVIGGIVARLAGVKSIVWNIRHTELIKGNSSRTSRLMCKVSSMISSFIPTQIVTCSVKAKDVHVQLGYQEDKFVVIFNGYDVSAFPFIEDIVSSKKFTISMIARHNPQKDHSSFFKSLQHLKDEADFEFTVNLVGKGMDNSNTILLEEIESRGIANFVSLLNVRSDVPSILSNSHLCVLSSSFGEGFPNVLAESMCCGTPCVSTKAGDAEVIVGDTGWLVECGDYLALADSIKEAFYQFSNSQAKWHSRRVSSRERIFNHFSLDLMLEKYSDVWQDCAFRKHGN